MGRIDVDVMLSEIDARQFLEWQVFANLSPFVEDRADVRTGLILHMLANVNRDSKKKPTPWPLEQFIPKFGDTPLEKKPEQSWQQQKMIGMQYALASQKKAG